MAAHPPVGIRDPCEEAARPSAVCLIGPGVLWPLRALALQALGLPLVLREPQAQGLVSLCDVWNAGLRRSRRVLAAGSPSFGLLDTPGAVCPGPRGAHGVGARHMQKPLRWPGRGALRGSAADTPAGSCGGRSHRGQVPTRLLLGAHWWGSPLEPRGDWPWSRGLRRGTSDHLGGPIVTTDSDCRPRHGLGRCSSARSPRPVRVLSHAWRTSIAAACDIEGEREPTPAAVTAALEAPRLAPGHEVTGRRARAS